MRVDIITISLTVRSCIFVIGMCFNNWYISKRLLFGCLDQWLGTMDVLQEDPLLVAHDICSSEQMEHSDCLIKMLESKALVHGKTYFVNGQLSSIGCNVMFAMIPNGEEVYGMEGFGIPDWNKFEVENLEHMFNMINKVLDDVGLMVFVSSKHIVSTCGDYLRTPRIQIAPCYNCGMQKPNRHDSRDEGKI